MNERIRQLAAMSKDEYIKFLEDRLKHQTEQTEKAMEMLAKLMGKLTT